MTLSNLLKTLLLGAIGDPDSTRELINALESGGGSSTTVREAFDADVNITDADQYIIYGSSTGTPFNINLPAGTAGKVFTLISKSTSTSDYNLIANGSDTFDGNVGTFDTIGSVIYSNGIWYKANS